MLIVYISSLIGTYFILKNTAYSNMQESNNKKAIYYQQTLTTSFVSGIFLEIILFLANF